MNTRLTNTLLIQFSDFIKNEIGLNFSQDKLSDLERGIHSAAKIFKFDDTETCIQWLMTEKLNKKQVEILASTLTVGETYFFRDHSMFDLLEKEILPMLIEKRINENDKRIRIWSAGCSSGEEPYSIAITLMKLIPNISDWNITILATDINTEAMKKLDSGIYSEWSFRGVSEDIKESFFKETGHNKFTISADVKQLVKSNYLNLAQDSFPSLINNTNAMDIIFCKNVLMYFNPDTARKIAKNFFHCLVDGGMLFVSSVEVPQPYFNDYDQQNLDNTTVYYRRHPSLTSPIYIDNQELIVKSTIEIVKSDNVEVNITNEASHVDYKNLTLVLANNGKLVEALEANNKAIANDKINENLYYLRAMILLELGKNKEAMIALHKVLFLNPEHILAYFVLGNLSDQEKNHKASLQYFDAALQLLSNLKQEDIIEDMTVGRLIEIITYKKKLECKHDNK
jgi:chemotaxis protein methyltransferase CheR